MLSKEIPRLGASLETESIDYSLKVPFHKVYELEEELNEGGFGKVYKGHHVSHPKENLAVKVMNRNSSNEEDKAVAEVSILRKLKELPHVIKLVDFYMDYAKMYSVQALANGGDLFDRLVQKTTYTEKDARDLAKILLQTIDSMHRLGVVHRDIKPENILLKDEFSDYDIFLCDFDLARQLKGNIDRGMHTYCGTPAYNAPEVLNMVEYGRKVDVWSTGCVLYMLLGGYSPFGDDLCPDLFYRITHGDFDFEEESWEFVSVKAKNLISGMLNVDPNERWTIEQALESDWFTKCTSKRLRRSNLSRSLENIRWGCANKGRTSTRMSLQDFQSYCVRQSTLMKPACGVNSSCALKDSCLSGDEQTTRTLTDTDFSEELDQLERFSLSEANKQFENEV